MLPYRRPPLTENSRMHHMAEYRIRQRVKHETRLLARHYKVPHLDAALIELVWYPGSNRRADADNIAPTLKPCIDGLVAAGVLTDDNAGIVLRTSQRVVLRSQDPLDRKDGRLHLYVTDASPLAHPDVPEAPFSVPKAPPERTLSAPPLRPEFTPAELISSTYGPNQPTGRLLGVEDY